MPRVEAAPPPEDPPKPPPQAVQNAERLLAAVEAVAGSRPAPEAPAAPAKSRWSWWHNLSRGVRWLITIVLVWLVVISFVVIVAGLYVIFNTPKEKPSAVTQTLTSAQVDKMIKAAFAPLQTSLAETERRRAAAEIELSRVNTQLAAETRARTDKERADGETIKKLSDDLAAATKAMDTAMTALENRLRPTSPTPVVASVTRVEFDAALTRLAANERGLQSVTTGINEVRGMASAADGKATKAVADIAVLQSKFESNAAKITVLELARASIEGHLAAIEGRVKALEARPAAPALPAPSRPAPSSPLRPGKIDPDWFKTKP